LAPISGCFSKKLLNLFWQKLNILRNKKINFKIVVIG
jgi:hypothetical protein